MAKKKSGGGINFKQILLQKGERYGFYAAAAVLVLFLCVGGFKAANSESTTAIVGKFDKGVKEVNQKIARKPGDDPAPLNPVIYDDPTVARIPFTKYTVGQNWYDIVSNEQTKRLNPRLLSPTAAQMDFVRGSVEVYDIVEQPDGKRVIAVITQREKKGNQAARIPKRISAGGRAKQPTPPPPQPINQPAAPPPPPGGMAGPRGRGLPGGGIGGAQNVKSTEPTVEYKDVTSKDIDAAQLAQTILPERMVVVTCTIPYRQQVEEYRRALRAAKTADLSDFPEYRGYVVERRVLALDGKSVEQDWAELDVKGSLKDLYSRTIDFEPENPPNELPADLKTLYPRILPPEEFELLLPRPKLYRGDYPGVILKTATEALQSLLAKGEKAVEIRTQTQNLIDETNPFKRANSGGGTGGGFQPGALLPGGKSGYPPGGRFLPGAPPQPGTGPSGQGQQRPEDEDAWLMRFIDITCEAGHLYQYRVALKALNPNHQKPAKELAVPQLAEKEFLQSEFFEIPTTATVPPEEYLYAASRDNAKNHNTEKLPAAGLWDETWLQMQRWYTSIRPDGFSRAEPFGEWLVADLKAFRGQYVGEKLLLPLPIWSMENGMFLFRDNPARAPKASPIRSETGRRTDPNWSIDLYPTPPVLLVDFEGGAGQYFGPRHTPIAGGDVAGVEMLLLSADGKLRVARSGQDIPDADRAKRETGWTQWLEKVNADTLATKMGNTGGPGDLGGRRDR